MTMCNTYRVTKAHSKLCTLARGGRGVRINLVGECHQLPKCNLGSIPDVLPSHSASNSSLSRWLFSILFGLQKNFIVI